MLVVNFQPHRVKCATSKSPTRFIGWLAIDYSARGGSLCKDSLELSNRIVRPTLTFAAPSISASADERGLVPTQHQRYYEHASYSTSFVGRLRRVCLNISTQASPSQNWNAFSMQDKCRTLPHYGNSSHHHQWYVQLCRRVY